MIGISSLKKMPHIDFYVFFLSNHTHCRTNAFIIDKFQSWKKKNDTKVVLLWFIKGIVSIRSSHKIVWKYANNLMNHCRILRRSYVNNHRSLLQKKKKGFRLKVSINFVKLWACQDIIFRVCDEDLDLHNCGNLIKIYIYKTHIL